MKRPEPPHLWAELRPSQRATLARFGYALAIPANDDTRSILEGMQEGSTARKRKLDNMILVARKKGAWYHVYAERWVHALHVRMHFDSEAQVQVNPNRKLEK